MNVRILIKALLEYPMDAEVYGHNMDITSFSLGAIIKSTDKEVPVGSPTPEQFGFDHELEANIEDVKAIFII